MNKAVRVLLVEDELVHVKLFERNVKRFGANLIVDVVDNGQHALDYLATYAQKPAAENFAVLLDLNIPVLTGFQVLERMRKNPKMAKLPVIVLSTSDDPEEMARCKALGVEHFLVKPISYELLMRILEAAPV
ncbi:MAG: response regulator [Anaerolineae bacterium]